MFAVTIEPGSIWTILAAIVATIIIVVGWLYWRIDDLLIVVDVAKWFWNLFHKDEEEN